MLTETQELRPTVTLPKSMTGGSITILAERDRPLYSIVSATVPTVVSVPNDNRIDPLDVTSGWSGLKQRMSEVESPGRSAIGGARGDAGSIVKGAEGPETAVIVTTVSETFLKTTS
jgi:hypothetical protein